MSTAAKSSSVPGTRAEMRQVARVLRRMRQGNTATLHVRIDSGNAESTTVEMDISAAALDRITELIEQDRQPAVSGRSKEEMTTQEAAHVLGVSRPYLIKLLDAGKIPYRRVGHYRRIRHDDVKRFEQDEQKRRCDGLNELAAFTQEIGLDY